MLLLFVVLGSCAYVYAYVASVGDSYLCMSPVKFQQKWGWSILFWEIGVMLVNAYISYKNVDAESGKDKNPLSQHDFRRSVALSWVNPEVHYNNDSNGTSIPTWKRRKANSVNSSAPVESSVSSEKHLISLPITDPTLSLWRLLSIRLDLFPWNSKDEGTMLIT